MRRTALAIAREHFTSGAVTHDRAALLWQLTTHKTAVAANVPAEIQGRTAIFKFWEWLKDWTLTGLQVTRQVNVEFSRRRHADVTFTADFIGTWKRRTTLALLTPPAAGILTALMGLDDARWVVFPLVRSLPFEPPKLVQHDQREVAGVIEQGWRGIGHRLVWPHQDERCAPCPYRDICSPGDARRYLLRTNSKMERVRKRVTEERALGAQDL